ncbi:MAG: Ig-like domain-containing protein [Gammaproteobacteria bacterium]|nr:Ig-like domain-containing protein [Gammaproteobacteria bacterium]
MTFNVANAVNSAVPTDAFQTESFGEDALSSQASVTGTVSLLEGVSDIDDVASVITVGTVNGSAAGVGVPFNVNLTYDDGSGPQVVTVQITVAADGSYQISNTAVLDALPDGVTASGTFQFQAQDDSGALSQTQTFTVNVQGIDDATVTAPDSLTINEDTITGVLGTFGVLSNDSDIDNVLTVDSFTIAGDTTNYTAGSTVTIAGVATFTLNSDGSYFIEPELNYNGPVPVVTYTTNTGATDTLTITINPINDPALADEVRTTSNLVTDIAPLGFPIDGSDIAFIKVLDVGGGLDGNLTVIENSLNDPADLGGQDIETTEANLVFNIESLPDYGDIYVYDGSSYTRIDTANLSTTDFSTAGEVYWVATHSRSTSKWYDA